MNRRTRYAKERYQTRTIVRENSHYCRRNEESGSGNLDYMFLKIYTEQASQLLFVDRECV